MKICPTDTADIRSCYYGVVIGFWLRKVSDLYLPRLHQDSGLYHCSETLRGRFRYKYSKRASPDPVFIHLRPWGTVGRSSMASSRLEGGGGAAAQAEVASSPGLFRYFTMPSAATKACGPMVCVPAVMLSGLVPAVSPGEEEILRGPRLLVQVDHRGRALRPHPRPALAVIPGEPDCVAGCGQAARSLVHGHVRGSHLRQERRDSGAM